MINHTLFGTSLQHADLDFLRLVLIRQAVLQYCVYIIAVSSVSTFSGILDKLRRVLKWSGKIQGERKKSEKSLGKVGIFVARDN